MKPVDFNGMTHSIGFDKELDYGNVQKHLPIQYYEPNKTSLSCWKMTWGERFRALLYGKIWMAVETLPIIHHPVNIVVEGGHCFPVVMYGGRK